MARTFVLRRLVQLASCAISLFAVLGAQCARADQIEEHNALVSRFIHERGAAPLVADCAAHASFVVPTSPRYDHVEFLQTALDDQHATTEPWSQPFGNGKQRITVDTVVTISGLAYLKNPNVQPDLLTFRCGYVQDKMLAFSDNEPALSAAPSGGRHGSAHKGHGKGRHTGKASAKGTGKNASKSASKARKTIHHN